MPKKNVTVGKPKVAGGIYRGATTVTLPKNASAELSTTDFKNLGYVSEDGVTESVDLESDDIKAWGGDYVINTQTGKKYTYQFQLIETLGEEANKFVFGDDNVSVDSDTNEIVIKKNADELGESSFVIDMKMRNGALERTVIPCGKISELGEIVYKDDEIVAYDVTITAIPDDSGQAAYTYIKPAS